MNLIGNLFESVSRLLCMSDFVTSIYPLHKGLRWKKQSKDANCENTFLKLLLSDYKKPLRRENYIHYRTTICKLHLLSHHLYLVEFLGVPLSLSSGDPYLSFKTCSSFRCVMVSEDSIE